MGLWLQVHPCRVMDPQLSRWHAWYCTGVLPSWLARHPRRDALPAPLLLQRAQDVRSMTPDVRCLHCALWKAGVISVYVEFSDTEHGFDLIGPKWSPAAQAATYDTERFLAPMA